MYKKNNHGDLSKKGPPLNSVSYFSIFVLKSKCSLKKKKGPHLKSVFNFPLFVPKS